MVKIINKRHEKLLKAVFLSLFLFLTTSCSMVLYPETTLPDYRVVSDYHEQMELLKTNFPEIYGMFDRGLIIIDKVYTYKTEDGIERVHVTYHYIWKNY